VWDAGHGYEKADADRYSYVVLGVAGALTVLTWLIGLTVW
jgi:hypothetical protein